MYTQPTVLNKSLTGVYIDLQGVRRARALAVSRRLSLLQRAVLEVLYSAVDPKTLLISPMSYDEIALALGSTRSAVRKTCWTLKSQHLLAEKTPGRGSRPAVFGVPKAIWEMDVVDIVGETWVSVGETPINTTETQVSPSEGISPATQGHSTTHREERRSSAERRLAPLAGAASINKVVDDDWGTGLGGEEKPTQSNKWTPRGKEDDWDDPVNDEKITVPSKKPSGPLNRLREAFREITADIDKPEVSSRAAQMRNLKWLLDQGYTEEQLVESFRALAKRGSTNSDVPSRWDAYMRRKGDFLGKAAHLGKDVQQRQTAQQDIWAAAAQRTRERIRKPNLDPSGKASGRVPSPDATTRRKRK